MPWSKAQSLRIVLSMQTPVRRLFGDHAVRRQVQGVQLTLPRAHMLPVFAKLKPGYGQNLVQLAHELAAAEPEPIAVLDVGANIGDSALQIVAGADARVLCVEADPYWARYLHDNVDPDPRVVVEEALLLSDDAAVVSAGPVRDHGTTRFVVNAGADGALPSMTAGELRARNAAFDRLRLVKSDTDGYDAVLVPAVARAWRDAAPVLFFEFDPALARKAGVDADSVWGALAELGYSHLAIWDNAGDPLGQLDIAQAAAHASTLEPIPDELGYQFWDVAACHADDTVARAAFDRLVPQSFSPVPAVVASRGSSR